MNETKVVFSIANAKKFAKSLIKDKRFMKGTGGTKLWIVSPSTEVLPTILTVSKAGNLYLKLDHKSLGIKESQSFHLPMGSVYEVIEDTYMPADEGKQVLVRVANRTPNPLVTKDDLDNLEKAKDDTGKVYGPRSTRAFRQATGNLEMPQDEWSYQVGIISLFNEDE
jgi:hypothetical protein